MKGQFKLFLLASILLAGILGILVVVYYPAWAQRSASDLATITVNTLDDELNSDGDCSLREAINAANTNLASDACAAGSAVITDTITFAVQGIIQLIEQLDVASTGPLVLDGAGTIILDGGTGNYRIFNANSGADLTLEGLHMNSGSADEGGGIYNSGELVLRNSILTNNVAWSYSNGGGGIYNIGTLSIISSTLVGNYTFYNTGGGIYNLGHLTLKNSILNNNGAYYNGGGIYNGGIMTVTNSTLSGNSAGYYGGGIENFATVFLTNSTLTGNNALDGGGISNRYLMTITNSTLSGNAAGHDGGGVYAWGPLIIESSTLAYNSAGGFGGGIRVSGIGGYRLLNSILANNTAANEGPDCSASILSSEGYNFIGDMSGCDFGPTTGDLTGIDAKLGPLLDNGGPTVTHALSSGSLAINAGNPKGCTDDMGNPLTSDQRGFPRYGRCDIGAYEWQPAPLGPEAVFLPAVFRSCSNRLYFDDFSNPNSGWPKSESTNVLIEYLNNEYRILVKNPRVSAGASPGYVISDYIVVSDVRNVTGFDGAYGIIFDLTTEGSQFYVFGIGPDSKYAIWRVTEHLWLPLASGFSESIHTGTASNQLKIERKSGQIWAYANGELLNIIDDATLTGSRHLGLIVQSNAEPNVDIRFDNFVVNAITCGSSNALLSKEVGIPAAKIMELDLTKNWESLDNRRIMP